MKANGDVNLRAARKEGSWLNRISLGVLGRQEAAETREDTVKEKSAMPEHSWLNRISLGLLDKPQAESGSQDYTPANESLNDKQRNK